MKAKKLHKNSTPKKHKPNKIITKKKKLLLKKKRKQRTNTGVGGSNNSRLNPNAFYIVPWRRSLDWNNVCTLFNNEKYEDVIKELAIWRERVPSLPVGAESTIFLLRAIVSDQQNKSDDETQSLYALAVVRYLNHISHLATKEMGDDAPVPLSRLASHLNVPEWMVELRHAISHGITLPSLEILHEAADFIKTWLSENYWVDPEKIVETITDPPDIEILTNKDAEPKETKYINMCKWISAFIASKIYHLRGTKLITDPEITHSIANQPWSVKPKLAMGFFKTKISNFLTKEPQLLCTALVNEMIPEESFLDNFCVLFNIPTDDEKLIFEKYYQVWAPFIELIQSKGRLPRMCTLLAKEHSKEDATKTVKLFTALWLDNLLEKLGQQENVFPFRLKSIVYKVVSNPNEFTERFFPRLLTTLQNHLGAIKIQQLETLFNIWMVDDTSNTKRNQSANGKLFTVDDVLATSTHTNDEALQPSQNHLSHSVGRSPSKQQSDWDTDNRDSHFWRKVSFGDEI